MLYNLIKKYRGKQTIIQTDSWKKCSDRMKQLKNSQQDGVIKGYRVEYVIQQAGENAEKKEYKAIGACQHTEGRYPKKP